MDKSQEILIEAIRNAERAVALLKDCRMSKNGKVMSAAYVRSIAEAARDELVDAQTDVINFIKCIRSSAKSRTKL